MMKTKSVLTITLLSALLSISSCSSSPQNKSQVSSSAEDDRMDYDVADEQYQADYKEYRAQANAMLSDNDQRLIEFKSRIKQEKGDAELMYDRKVARLEAKNKELKEQLQEYTIGGKDQWESFKVEFDYDMTALGKSFNDLAAEHAQE